MARGIQSDSERIVVVAKKDESKADGKAGTRPRPCLHEIPSFDEDWRVRAVVETPRASTYKLAYDAETGTFHFRRALPLGLAYPYDFGFVPNTEAPDGDPLDVIVVHDVATFPGAVIPSRILGVVRLSQKEKGGKRAENDRVVVTPAEDAWFERLDDVPKDVRRELEHFFVESVAFEGKKVRIEGWDGPRRASETLERARKAAKRAE
jgi:inorganic pyrophosphatase